MGKPYQSELAAIPKTIAWALKCDVSQIEALLRSGFSIPFIATGSGGSLSAARLAANLHQLSRLGFAKSATPLELLFSPALRDRAKILMLSAGGSNTDIKGVFKHLAEFETAQTLAITARLGTPLSKMAQHQARTECLELALPSGRDGFLATNSLVAFSIAIARAFASVVESEQNNFRFLHRISATAASWRDYLGSLEKMCQPLWERDNLVVLYSPETEAGALDIESKFTEAALGSVHIADYRHFAHGRHHWLAKRGRESAVLAFTTKSSRRTAEETLNCLPKEIPVGRIHCDGDIFEAGVASILSAVVLTGFCGRARRIDPGRPGVPEFGRKIYHLRWRSEVKERNGPLASAAERKVSVVHAGLGVATEESWKRIAVQFCERISKCVFKGIVFDFDGTLVFTNRRFGPVMPRIALFLAKLLRAGVTIGVASGRGKSLRQTLQAALPKSFWNRVILGYYNGGQISLLSDDTVPEMLPVEAALTALQAELRNDRALRSLLQVDTRQGQLSVTPTKNFGIEELWAMMMDAVSRNGASNLRIVRSAHSVDIIAASSTKLAVLERVRAAAEAERSQILTIGDRGHWPGNDFELLRDFPSLSVDEVSTSADTCWNFAPRGLLGPDALCVYLAAMKVTKRGVRFDPRNIKGK